MNTVIFGEVGELVCVSLMHKEHLGAISYLIRCMKFAGGQIANTDPGLGQGPGGPSLFPLLDFCF